MNSAEQAKADPAGSWMTRLWRAVTAFGYRLRAGDAYQPERHYMRGPGPASREAEKRRGLPRDGEPA